MRLHHHLSRRALLRAALAATSLAALPARLRADSAYTGAFVDAHSHLKWDVGSTIDDLIQLYDAAGVSAVLLFADPWPIGTEARDRYPLRVQPFLAEGYANALHPHSSYMNPDGLAELLSGRYVVGLGEIICRHSPYQLGAAGGYASAPANNVPADHPALLAAYGTAARFHAPVNVHQEWFYAAELERALRAAPETTFVWAHAGHGPAAQVAPLFRRNANLMADISARTPWIGPGTVLLRGDGSLEPAWAGLLEEFADRFMVGLDLFAPAHFAHGYVQQLVSYYRGLLGQLDPAVA
ncbi:MAG: hypothetical protein M3336_06365, partial [Chloroflexota bacterium]|nr:hypothetical protein [Chloroflexota bacterium]